MPKKLLKKIGLNQHQVYGVRMLMYGTPLLMYMQIPNTWLVHSLKFFESRIFSDYDFLTGLLMLVMFDTLTGGIRAFKSYKMTDGLVLKDIKGRPVRQFSGMVFYEKMSKKLFGITIAVLCLGVLKNTKISGEEAYLQELVSSGFYSIMLGFEGASVLKNAYGVYPWEPIKIALQRLDIFINRKTNEVE
jgi:hypothetical protein